MPAAPEFFNPRADLHVHTRRLPHWQQDRVAVFVTWRLADALPAETRAQWRTERETWLLIHPQPWDDKTEDAYHTVFSERFDAWLDAGSGRCVLRASDARVHLNAAFMNRNGLDYDLYAFVVMPNHAHVLFSPREGHSWETIVGVWKSVAAHRINRALHRHGALWQEESWDRLVRHAQHFAACLKYIQTNPIRAKLRIDEYSWFEAPIA